jgi:adenosine deaminase
MSFFKPKATTRSIPPQPVCGEGNVRAESAFNDQKLYDALVDSFSMRSFVPSAGTSGTTSFSRPSTASAASTVPRRRWLDDRDSRSRSKRAVHLEIRNLTPSSPTLQRSAPHCVAPTPADPALNRTGDATGTPRDPEPSPRRSAPAGLRDESPSILRTRRRTRRPQQD